MAISRTVIIPCAGMGTRLGLSIPKALLDVDGKPLIIRHLEQLDEEEDIRIVVGYQAERIIEAATAYRKDIIFVLNHDYQTTGTGASVVLAAKHANEYILTLDGDLLVHPKDMKRILSCTGEFVGGATIETDDPWMVQTYSENGTEYASAFSKCRGSYEWTGITQIKSEKIQKGLGHVFHLVEPWLPLELMSLKTMEIDTLQDYERAVAWFKAAIR